MTPEDEKLDAAYALKSPDDSRRLYAEWADTYDADFAARTGYRLPEAVAAAYVAGGGTGAVLDIGAGTGLVGEQLAARGVAPVDGTDISPRMLGRASAKQVYRRLFEGDVTRGLEIADGTYEGVVSAGTFTLGHLGPEVLPELLRLARPGAFFALSINAAHFAAAGFETTLSVLAIDALKLDDVPIYAGEEGHEGDRAHIATFRKIRR